MVLLCQGFARLLLAVPLCGLLAIGYPVKSAVAQGFIDRPEVQEYVRRIAREHELDQNRIAGLLSRVNTVPSVLEAISRPAERVLDWSQYRPIFIKQKRIDAGVEFLRTHRVIFERAEREYGVPASVIAAIIGVETFFGRITGKHGVLESVATLAFDYPPRSRFFTSELTEFLVLAETENWDALAISGSYAGAMGMPQFISSSYRQYAVDFDGDGTRDLFSSVEDVIGSVANYLSRHGWQPGQPVAGRLPTSSPDQRTTLKQWLRKSLKPAIAADTLRRAGFSVDGEQHVSVMKFDGSSGEELWVGYKNFYVITRYNHSAMYALAVHQLSQMLE